MGARNRFYISPADWSDELSLTGDEAKHCARVFRHQVGDEIEVFDGQGGYAVASIVAIDGSRVSLAKVSDHDQAPPPKITLAPALLKGKSFEVIIQKACEIGVAEIVPLHTEHCIARISPADFAKKTAKWERTAIEACKQSGLTYLPKISAPRTLAQLVEADDAELKLVAAISPSAQPLHQIIADSAVKSACVVVGPEGDFQADELAYLKERGYEMLGLGANVLRAETAAVHAVSILAYEMTR